MPARASLFALLVIVSLAGPLRGFRLDSVPPGFYLDEASIGVEAHTLAETGADSTGTRWPIVFRALQDWKHPLYVYGAAASVKALGPTRTAVRLPAVIFGTLTVLLIGLLALELTGDARAALFAAIVLALSPWHIQYSRMAWEAVTLGFSTVLALWLYFVARRRGGAWRFALAGASFGLVLYSYTPAKLLLPAFLAVLAFIEWRDWSWTGLIGDRVRKHVASLPLPPVDLGFGDILPIPRNAVGKRDAYAAVGALLLVAAPMVVFQVLHFDEIQTRFRAVSVFREASPIPAIGQSYAAHL
ncbi:MAG: ArnT family glycosyltransferase, partial [Planctomycetota bacterium]